MDFNHLLKNVNNVDQYISLTQEINDKNKDTKVQINITTVLALKKIKSLEIEYLIKCYENGAACIIFERLLKLPPSKAWGALGKELVSILKYWLEAIRKYLINHSVHWWSFLKLILKFIKEMYQKDPSMPDILVELTLEHLFDIVTRDNTDTHQRHEILHCLNVFCAESSREIRFALRSKFADYFTKLASDLASTSYLPYQYSTLETLMRWLVPRQDANLRAAAAARWFPSHLYPDSSREIFLTTKWKDCFQDARDFLNALNEAKGLVTSMLCRRLTVGKTLIISGAEKHGTWIDINSGVKCMSVLLGPKVSETFGNGKLDRRACESLVIAEDNTQNVRLTSDCQELKISVTTFNPPSVLPSGIEVGESNDVTLVISARGDVTKLDAALRNVFGEKYYLQMDLNGELSLSPPRSRDVRRNYNSSEEDTRFSHPVELNRRKHGVLVRSRDAAGLASPSTASTSSLAQLHDKLAALPRYRFDKEPVSVCAQPQLSSVTEITEPDTNKYRPSGFRHKKLISIPHKDTKRRAESDSETLKLKARQDRHLSPVLSDENSASCLLIATVGSADDTVINETVKRLSKSKDFKSENIVDLLIQEALQSGPIAKEKLIDSGINSGEKKSLENEEENSEAIENTPVQDDEKNTAKKNRIVKKKVCTVVSKSTTDDESNTETINDTPVYTNVRNRNRRQTIFKAKEPEPIVTDKRSFDIQAVEQFFSQHFAETKAGEIVISPSLAKKINESSSDASENFDENYLLMNEPLNADLQFEFNDIDIVECLNDMVDKVCADFEKCTQNMNKAAVMEKEIGTALADNILRVSKEPTTVSAQQKERPVRLKRSVTLTYKAKDNKKTIPKKKKKKESQPEPIKKMSTIIEQKEEEIQAISSPKRIVQDVPTTKIDSPVIKEYESPTNKSETPSAVKRKRKLYSPKDDDAEKNKDEMVLSEPEDDDVVLAKLKTYVTRTQKTPLSCATCYKDIEQERQKRIRLPRTKKSRGKFEEPLSPRTLKKNAVFDKLKATVESKEEIVLANKKFGHSNVFNFNFTSEDEDEDFQQKKVEIQKRTSNTTLTSKRRGRPRTGQNYSEKSSNDDVNTKMVKKKQTVKKRNSKIKVNIEPVMELNDERMRTGGPEELDSSTVVEKPKPKKPTKAFVELRKTPEMEPISDDQEITATVKRKLPKKNTKKTEIQALKKDKSLAKKGLVAISDKEDDRTVSPLPGLIVETAPINKDDADDSVTTNMLQKFRKIYQEGPDGTNESSNTQNLLLADTDRFNNSPQNVSINITDEVRFIDYRVDNTTTKIKGKKAKKSKPSKKADQSILDKTKLSFQNSIGDEVIEITEGPDTKSEISIATVGITAHGNFDEEPPSPELIRKRLEPREMVDLNESMREYFVQLHEEINESASKDQRQSSKSKDAPVVSDIKRPVSERSPSVKSPLVAVERLSFDDINRWIPSRRTSDTSESERSSTILQKKSLEEPNKPLKLVCNTKRSENVKDGKNADETKKKMSVLQKPKTECVQLPGIKKANPIFKTKKDSGNVTDHRLRTPRRTKNTPVLDENQLNADDRNCNNNYDKTTIISSIKSFGEFVADVDGHNSLESSDRQIKKIILKQKDKVTKKDVTKSPQKVSSPESFTQFIFGSSQDSLVVQSQSSQSEKERLDSVSLTEIEDLFKYPMKREASPIFNEPKRKSKEQPKNRKSEANVDTVTIQSGLSASSINDWLRRLEPSPTTAPDTRLAYHDVVQNVIEKLNTTVVEGNLNTSKILANLFIEAQNTLTKHKEDSQNMYKAVTKNVMAEMESILNKNLMEINARSDEMQTEFMRHLKRQAFDLIRKDCKQKRVMVQLLKEDVQAVSDHIKNKEAM